MGAAVASPSLHAARCAVGVFALDHAAAMGAAGVSADPAARDVIGVRGVTTTAAMGAAVASPSLLVARCAVGVFVLDHAAALVAAGVDPAARDGLDTGGVVSAAAMGSASAVPFQRAVGVFTLLHTDAKHVAGVSVDPAARGGSGAHGVDADRAELGVRARYEPSAAVMIGALLCGGLALFGVAVVKGILLIGSIMVGDVVNAWKIHASHIELPFEAALSIAVLIVTTIIGGVIIRSRSGIAARLTWSRAGRVWPATAFLLMVGIPRGTAAPLPPPTAREKRDSRVEARSSQSMGVAARIALFVAIFIDFTEQLLTVGLQLLLCVILPGAFVWMSFIVLRWLFHRCGKTLCGSWRSLSQQGIGWPRPPSAPLPSPPPSPPGEEPSTSSAPPPGASGSPPMGSPTPSPMPSDQASGDEVAAAASSAMAAVQRVDDLGEWLREAGAPSVDAPPASAQLISDRSFHRLRMVLTTSQSRRSAPAAFVHPHVKGDSGRCRNVYERILQQRLGSDVMRPYRVRGRHVSTGVCRHLAIVHGVELPPYEALANAEFNVTTVDQSLWCVPDDCRRTGKLIAKDGMCPGFMCVRCSVKRGAGAYSA